MYVIQLPYIYLTVKERNLKHFEEYYFWAFSDLKEKV